MRPNHILVGSALVVLGVGTYIGRHTAQPSTQVACRERMVFAPAKEACTADAMIVADLDGDQHQDLFAIIVSSPRKAQLEVYPSSQRFRREYALRIPPGVAAQAVRAVDADGDRIKDLVVGEQAKLCQEDYLGAHRFKNYGSNTAPRFR